jgi:hypothetical protein
MTPGQRAFEAYAGSSGGRSLISGEKLAGWDGLPADIQRAWEAAASAGEARTEINGVTATRCQLGAQDPHHVALRYIWHHILPQVCGGKSTKSNLAELCDNCHYAVHRLMWDLAHGITPPREATGEQFTLANTGYQLAVQAGTAGKIPKESSG